MTTPENHTPSEETVLVKDPAHRLRKLNNALTRYRVLAWITGVWLLILVGEMVLKYILKVDMPDWTNFIPPAHGWVYFVYLLATFNLAVKVRWPLPKTIGILLAGTIPLLGIIVEHFQSRNIKTQFNLYGRGLTSAAGSPNAAPRRGWSRHRGAAY